MTAILAIPDAEYLSSEEYFERKWSAIVRHKYIGAQWLFAYAAAAGFRYFAARDLCAGRMVSQPPRSRGATNDLAPDASSFSKHNTYAHITYPLALRLFRRSSRVGANRFRLGN